jgi:DNA-binding PadR family transcriptional regulator
VQRAELSRGGDITRMVLLGALARGPAHGYEVKARLERWHMDLWAGVQLGSLYAGLGRLHDEGLIEEIAVEHRGNLPQRRVFRLTASGADALERLLLAAWSDTARLARPIDVAVSFYPVLDAEEIAARLRSRLETLGAQRAAITFVASVPQSGDPAIDEMVHDLLDHDARLLEAELSWTTDLLKKFERGGYGPPNDLRSNKPKKGASETAKTARVSPARRKPKTKRKSTS